LPLTRQWRKRVWRTYGLSFAASASSGGQRRARQGRQRSPHRLGSRSITPQPGNAAGGAADRSTRQDRAAFRSRHRSGLRPRPIDRQRHARLAEAGSVAVKRSSTRVVQGGSGRGGWRSTEGRKARRRARSRIDQSEGCSCRRSVAEIGEKRLLRKSEARRKANRDERSSLKRPPRS